MIKHAPVIPVNERITVDEPQDEWDDISLWEPT